VLDWGSDHPREWEILRGKGRHIVKYNCAKTAEPIEMSFGIWTRAGPRKQAIDEGAHWRLVANTTEPYIRGGSDAAFLSNYFDHLL